MRALTCVCAGKPQGRWSLRPEHKAHYVETHYTNVGCHIFVQESGAFGLQEVVRMCRPSGMAIVRSFGEIMVSRMTYLRNYGRVCCIDGLFD